VALAAVVAMVVAILGAGAVIQVIVFIVGAVASLALVRPIAKAHLRMPAELRTGTAALTGRPLIDLREQVVSFQPQPAITEDNLVVNIDTVLYFQITDPKAARTRLRTTSRRSSS